ncbi:hypothetical protein [Pseudomonas allokribbensis]|uniref:hypothetical protein n=1 Tax=Pseudomonas allokribbensis TaxID=2774460 RepID=UPI001787D521|nr:hypothetical protein [Pseudomonas allokribbensis]
MNVLKKTVALLRSPKKKAWADLNDLALAFIGVPSFLVGSFYLWVVTTTTPDLLILSRDHGLPLSAIFALFFLGGLALSSWFFLTVAKRCSELLYERNFK